MNLNDFILREELVLYESIQNHRDIISNVYELVMLLSDVVISNDMKVATFFLLSGQVRNDLVLCLLSSLRSHETQAKLMKRHAIEKAC